MLAGIAFLAKAYGIAATAPGEAGYQSVLSQLLAAITGNGIFYGVSIGSILLVLALSANTAFADFPRLSGPSRKTVSAAWPGNPRPPLVYTRVSTRWPCWPARCSSYSAGLRTA